MFEKIMPRMFVYAYDPERIEEMLDRKSREGWQCYEVGLFYCFHRGEPDGELRRMDSADVRIIPGGLLARY